MFNAIPNKVPAKYFLDIDKILDFICKVKGIRLAKTILKKKNKVEEIILLSFKTYYIVTVIKTVWCWWRDGYFCHCNREPRKRSTEICPAEL